MAGKKAKARKTDKKLDFEKLDPAVVLCPICKTILAEPVTLPCHHVFCKVCFEGTMENANLVCPLCRLRVGSWFRKAKKEGKIVDQEFWRAIQQQYPVEVNNKLQGIDNDIEEEKPVIIVATPGAIREEYEKEREKDLEEQRRIRDEEEKASAALIKQLKEEEEYKRQVEEEKLRLDAIFAKQLAEKLSTPSTSKINNIRRPAKIENYKKYGPMDRFVKTDDIVSSRNILPKKSDLNKPQQMKSNRKLISASPIPVKHFLGKEYTCHVLPVEQSPIRVNRANKFFDDLDFKGIFGTLGQKPTKTTDPDRRKSICTSGYKSSASGDNSDIIDQECKFYFKPIDTQRRYHVPGKMPLKISPILGVNDGNTPIEPPSGKICNLGKTISAFARYSVDPLEQRAPSCYEIEEETLSITPRQTVKRKVTCDNINFTRKRGRRHLFAMKKNLLKTETESVSSPFYGFNSVERAVSGSPFHGFNTLHVEESSREMDVVNKLVSRYEGTRIGAINARARNKSYAVYSRYRNKNSRLENPERNPKVPENLAISHNSGTAIATLIENKIAELESSMNRQKETNIHFSPTSYKIDTNTSLKVSCYDNIRISVSANSRSAKISNTRYTEKFGCVKSEPDPGNKFLDSNVESPKVEPALVSLNCTSTGDNDVKPRASEEKDKSTLRLSLTSRPQSNTSLSNGETHGSNIVPNHLSPKQESPVIGNVSKNPLASCINRDIKDINANQQNSSHLAVVRNSNLDSHLNTGSVISDPKLNKFSLSLGTPPGIFDSDSEDEGLSKLIATICNPNEAENTNTVDVSAVKYALNGPNNKKIAKNSPKVNETNLEGDSAAKLLNTNNLKKNSSRISKLTNTQVNDTIQKVRNSTPNSGDTNTKITDTFTKVKNSPPRRKNITKKLKSSPQKGLNCDLDSEQKRKQEEADFELAKKLQAEFDLIQVQSRTRRGTKRQITLDEMLTV